MSAPTYFGSASVPADNTTNATGTLTITPPGSMTVGDLVVVICQSRVSNTWSIGVTGGQTWTSQTAYTTTNCFCRIFWCRYNGTWAANPRFDSTSSTCTSAIMHVFRPDATSKIWDLDAAPTTNTFTAPTTPFTVTRTGRTTTEPDCVTLACFHSVDDNTWGSMSGTGWVLTGSAQYRNTSGSQQSATFAHHLDAAAAAVPNVSKNQATLGGDAGITCIITFYAFSDAVNLTSGLQLYVKMDEASAGDRADSSGNSRTATQTGTVASVSGKYTNACDFNTSTDYLMVAHASALAGNQDFTIAFWVYLDVDIPHNICDKNSGSVREYAFQYAGAAMNFYNQTGSINGGSLSMTAWHHILVTYKHTTGAMAMYVNGATTPNGTGTGVCPTPGTPDTQIGAVGVGAMDGRLCEWCFWNRRLGPSERAAVYAGDWFAPTPPSEGKPWYYYNQQMAA